MVKVKFFGTARVLLKDKEMEGDFKDVNEMVAAICVKYNVTKKDLKQYYIYVNEVNIAKLKKYKTELKDGDVVYLLSPASGG